MKRTGTIVRHLSILVLLAALLVALTTCSDVVPTGLAMVGVETLGRDVAARGSTELPPLPLVTAVSVADGFTSPDEVFFGYYVHPEYPMVTRAFLKFDLTDIENIDPSTLSAEYRMQIVEGHGSDTADIAVLRLTQAIPFRPELVPFDLSWHPIPYAILEMTVPSPFQGFTASWDVTSLVQSWLQQADSNHGFALVSTDESAAMWVKGLLTSAELIVTIGNSGPSENQPPVANAGPDRTVEQQTPDGALVVLDGSGSTDLEDDTPVSYEWTLPGGGTVSGVGPTVLIPPGTHEVALRVTDSQGSTGEDSVEVTVQDTTPPAIAPRDPITLWPPNNKMVDIDVASLVSVSDACDPAPALTVAEIAVSPAESGKGQKNAESDFKIDNEAGIVRLRAERDGSGSDRVYTITFLATDASENSAEIDVDVTVPHDQGKGVAKAKGRDR